MLLEVHGITKKFVLNFWENRKITAVDQVSFELEAGECLGGIGESGCGKSTLGRMICGLIPCDSGNILFQGEKLGKKTKKKELRRQMQMVFQYPQQAFNPKEKLIHAVREPIRNFQLASSEMEEKTLISEMIDSVGVTWDQLERYPHEISGGQAQRLAIARSLVMNPQLLIADEVTSMLDVSVQAQILNILVREQKKRNLGMLFVSHDLEVIRAICDKVMVMKNGKILEQGKTEKVFGNPQSDFTKYLLKSYINI